MKTNATMILVLCSILCSGCCCLPFLYPKTGADGVVLDQNDNPIPKAEMQARWCKRSLHDVMMPGQALRNFSSDSKGEWTYYARDAEDMFIEAQPPAGYERFGGITEFTLGPLTSGECRTNVVLRLRKIEPSPRPKDLK